MYLYNNSESIFPYEGDVFHDLVERLKTEKETSTDVILTSIRNNIIQKMSDPQANLQDLVRTTWYINMFDQQSAKLNQLILRCMANDNLKVKKIGYSACLDILSPDDEFTLMATSLIRKDLESSNMFVISFALQAASTMMSINMSHDLFPVIKTHLTSSRPYLRKKSIFALYRVYSINEVCAEAALDGILSMLKDPDYGVLAAVLCVLAQIARIGDHVVLIMTWAPRLLHILKNTTNNWVRIRLLKLLTLLCAHNNKLEVAINDFVQDKIQFAAYSVRYECLHTAIQTLQPTSAIYQSVKKQLFVVFDEADANLRLIGLKLLEIAARRDRETGSVDPIPEEYFEKMISLSDIDDGTTKYYALRAIAMYATGEQAASICEKLLDVGIKRNMPFLIFRVVDILEREDLLDKPTSLFLLGDMWRNSGLLGSSPDIMAKIDDLALKLSNHHRIMLIVIPTMDKDNTPRENVNPQLYATLLHLLENNIEETKRILKHETIPGYSMERFVELMIDFHESFSDDSLLYMTSACTLSMLGHTVVESRYDLASVFQLIPHRKEAEDYVCSVDLEAMRRTYWKQASPNVDFFDREEINLEGGMIMKETTQYLHAPWPDMTDCLPHVSSNLKKTSIVEFSKRTKDILLANSPNL